MPTIYRLQTPENVGPYRPQVRNQWYEANFHDEEVPHYVHHSWNGEVHPAPVQDGVPHHIFNRDEMFCGFESVEAFLTWFVWASDDPEGEYDRLHEYGLELWAYSVPEGLVHYGRRQVMFELPNPEVTVLSKFTLPELAQLV